MSSAENEGQIQPPQGEPVIHDNWKMLRPESVILSALGYGKTYASEEEGESSA